MALVTAILATPVKFGCLFTSAELPSSIEDFIVDILNEHQDDL
jgi:hypothetical protein